MGISLGFHIVFACIGMTMPWLFSWEGTAFFIEAIALGLFLYGWERLHPWVHFASGMVVGISGVVSGILVVAANGFMNSPRGFRWVDGHAVDVDPVAAMFNDAWASQALHMVAAAFVSTSFAVAGVHAYRLLHGHDSLFHRRAFRIAITLGAVFALLTPLTGDHSAKDVARRQPAKLAAMEAHYHTARHAGLLLGGIPDDQARAVHYGIELPSMLSVLAYGDPNAEVRGLDEFANRPPTMPVHFAFQVMVGIGSLLALVGATALFLRWRGALFERRFLRVVACCAPLGFIAVEAGWTVTEVGRQPWIIYGVMRTSEAVTHMPGLHWPLTIMTLVYAMLTFVVTVVLRRLISVTERTHDA
jgi:cytochrome d ubiquinol oxidase subunit I